MHDGHSSGAAPALAHLEHRRRSLNNTSRRAAIQVFTGTLFFMIFNLIQVAQFLSLAHNPVQDELSTFVSAVPIHDTKKDDMTATPELSTFAAAPVPLITKTETKLNSTKMIKSETKLTPTKWIPADHGSITRKLHVIAVSTSDQPKPQNTYDVKEYFAKAGQVIELNNSETWPVVANPKQRWRLRSDDRLGRYELAMTRLKHPHNLTDVDPLGDLFVEPTANNRLPFVPKVRYLGVVVDAGRHYFPIPWLKRLIQYLYRLHFNLLHLRLTDDQAFNIQLESYPQLARPSPTFPNSIYTPQELRHLVGFARNYNISIIPEVNVPGHAGAWSGIPNLTLHCPQFACDIGYGIPLNKDYEHLKEVLKGVIHEVIDIFDNPPFLHLGGDEVQNSQQCFNETGIEPFDYQDFEDQLKAILHEIKYPVDRVIRWEVTGPDTSNATLVNQRAGNILHHWYHLPGQKLGINSNYTYFNSWGLYMDNNDDEGAEQIFLKTVQSFQLYKESEQYTPTAILPAAFELDAEFWMQRNVAARLIAVAMGAAQLPLKHPEEILNKYEELCKYMGMHPEVCNLQGMTTIPSWKFKREWKKVWKTWRKNGTCPVTWDGELTQSQ